MQEIQKLTGDLSLMTTAIFQFQGDFFFLLTSTGENPKNPTSNNTSEGKAAQKLLYQNELRINLRKERKKCLYISAISTCLYISIKLLIITASLKGL